MANRQKPSRVPVRLSGLELIVRPSGDLFGIRVFTAAERIDAEMYAAEVSAAVETMPLPLP